MPSSLRIFVGVWMPLIGRRFKMGVCLEAGGRGNCSFTIYVNAVPGRSCYHLTLNVSFVISFSACQASRFDVSNFIFSRSNPCLRGLSYTTFLLLLKPNECWEYAVSTYICRAVAKRPESVARSRCFVAPSTFFFCILFPSCNITLYIVV